MLSVRCDRYLTDFFFLFFILVYTEQENEMFCQSLAVASKSHCRLLSDLSRRQMWSIIALLSVYLMCQRFRLGVYCGG